MLNVSASEEPRLDPVLGIATGGQMQVLAQPGQAWPPGCGLFASIRDGSRPALTLFTAGD